MAYEQAFQEAWSAGGPEGALGFLREIFHHPDNQHIKGKPTDYLSDGDEEIKTPAQGFDQMTRLFSPKQPLEQRVDFIIQRLTGGRTTACDQAHRVQPFNAIMLRVGTYDHGDGGFDSVHVDGETGRWKSQYGLNHEVIPTEDNYDEETDDDENSYDFIYELEEGDSFNITFEGNTLSGKALFRHIRMAQYGALAGRLVDLLLRREDFADFPKALPFRFLVSSQEYSSDEGQLEGFFFEFHAPLDEAALADHPLKERFLVASAPPPELTSEEKWLYLLKYIDEPRSSELEQLVALLRDHPELLAHTLTLADEALARHQPRTVQAPEPAEDGELTTALRQMLDSDLPWQQKLRQSEILAVCEAIEFDNLENVTELEEARFVRWIIDQARAHEAQLRAGDPHCLIQARKCSAARETPRVFARLLWRLGEDHRHLAEDYTRRVLALPVPELPRGDIEAAIGEANAVVQNIHPVWAYVPESARSALQQAYDGARQRISAAAHPVLKVLSIEGELRLAHGDKAIWNTGYDELGYNSELIPDAYVDAVEACIDEMPQTFQWYGDKWNFVMYRLAGLRERALSVGPRLLQLLDAYCAEPSGGGSQLLEEFAGVLQKIGLPEPPRLIRDYAEGAGYHNIEDYAQWASRAPTQKWRALADDFHADPAKYAVASSWEAALYDSKKGIDIFAKGIGAAKNSEAFLENIAKAASNAGPLLTRLVYRLAEIADKQDHTPSNPAASESILLLLGALPSLDEKPARMLRLIRLLHLRWAIDRGDDGASRMLNELLAAYPAHPMLLFCRVQLTNTAEGAQRAGQEALQVIQTLSAEDLVYRKAFLQYTGTEPETWQAASPEAAYAVFRWAVDHFVAEQYRDGQFGGSMSALDRDPFYAALEKVVAEWSEQQRAAALADIRAELALDHKLLAASDEQLCEHLSPDSWNVTLQVSRRLIGNSERFGEKLLDAYDWFREDEERRLVLASLYWPVESFRKALLRHGGFARDLAWFIGRYPGHSEVDLARQVFTLCAEMGLAELILKTAKGLDTQTVLGCFLSINSAIEKLQAYDEGIALMEAALDSGNSKRRSHNIDKKPELVLIKTNIAVLHMRKGNTTAAEAVFDELFARDFSRFDYNPEGKDDIVAEMLGGDLDARIAGVFRQYFASAKYNAACLYAKTERSDKAIEALREARAYFPDNYGAEKIANESDFDAIREQGGFRDLLVAIRKEDA